MGEKVSSWDFINALESGTRYGQFFCGLRLLEMVFLIAKVKRLLAHVFLEPLVVSTVFFSVVHFNEWWKRRECS